MTWGRKCFVSLATGLVLVALASVPVSASADQNPEPNPTSRNVSFLFAHDALRGTLTRVRGRQGVFTLRLSGVVRRALYFEDRPGRLSGSMPLRKMLNGLLHKSGTARPNAAINATRRGRPFLMSVTLLSARYSSRRHTLSYRVRAIGDRNRGNTARVLPPTFRNVSVYIDTIYNQCGATLMNDTGREVPLISAEKYSHDDWDPWYNYVIGEKRALMRNTWGDGTSPFVDGYGRGNVWQSESGFARGCWNRVKFGDDQGTVEIYLANPYSGRNTATCTATGNYRCQGPMMAGWGPNGVRNWPESQLSGDQLSAVFYMCWTGLPTPKYPPRACSGNR